MKIKRITMVAVKEDIKSITVSESEGDVKEYWTLKVKSKLM